MSMEENMTEQEGKAKFQDLSLAPMHTAEHILNQTMVRMFGCSRSRVNHIEKKKSKCNYTLLACPTEEQVRAIEEAVNAIIAADMEVTERYVTRAEVPEEVDLSKLPEDTSDTLRLVYVGDYDVCPCVGAHVKRTSEIGRFRISSTSYNEGSFRIVFRLATPTT